jgi:hypothetical protein
LTQEIPESGRIQEKQMYVFYTRTDSHNSPEDFD